VFCYQKVVATCFHCIACMFLHLWTRRHGEGRRGSCISRDVKETRAPKCAFYCYACLPLARPLPLPQPLQLPRRFLPTPPIVTPGSWLILYGIIGARAAELIPRMLSIQSIHIMQDFMYSTLRKITKGLASALGLGLGLGAGNRLICFTPLTHP
jgi:hypothetical protein